MAQRYCVRFLGDPTGYIIESNPSDCLGWTQAEVGFTGRKVWINVDKAYLVEPFTAKAQLSGD